MPFGPGGGGGAVASVFGRTGAVVAVSGDYTPAQVGAVPSVFGRTGAVVAVSGDYTAAQVGALPVYNVVSYGADPTGTDDSTTAVQAAINAAITDGGTVYIPPGTYAISSPLTVTGTCGIIGAGRYNSILKATAAIAQIVYCTATTACDFVDFQVDGNQLAVEGLVVSASPEAEIAHAITRVLGQGCTSFQLDNDQCEDTCFTDCEVPGNEASPNTTPYALRITVPTGASYMFGGAIFGQISVSAQLASFHGMTGGPFLVHNPNALPELMLRLSGCYIYDGGPAGGNCIDTPDNLTSIKMDGCYVVSQDSRIWINGNIPGGCSLGLYNTVWIWGPGTAGTNYILEASGSGFAVIADPIYSVGSATVKPFNPVTGATTRVRVTGRPTALTTPALPASGAALPNPFYQDCMVYVSDISTGTAVLVDGVELTTVGTSGAAPVYVPAGSTITLTYTSTPAWTWQGL